MPAITLNSSATRWFCVPDPGEATVMLPGVVLARATSSRTFDAATTVLQERQGIRRELGNRREFLCTW
jgi:hypothetical protein